MIKSLRVIGFITTLLFANYSDVSAKTANDNPSKNYLDFGTSYISNYSALGSTNSNVTQPSFSFLASYTYNNGLFGSVNHAIVLNSDTTMSESTSETDLSLGYTLNILPGFSAIGSYSHYFFSNKTSTLNSGYTSDFQLGLTLDTTLLYVSLSSSYLIGNADKSINLSAHLGVPYTLDISDEISVMVQPTVDINWGNQTYYNNWALKQYKFLISLAKLLPDYKIADLSTPVTKADSKEVRHYKILIKNSKLWTKKIGKLNSNSTVGELFASHNEYNITTLGYSIPVYLSFRSFSLNFSFTALKPQNAPSWVDNNWVYLYNAGLTYSIDW